MARCDLPLRRGGSGGSLLDRLIHQWRLASGHESGRVAAGDFRLQCRPSDPPAPRPAARAVPTAGRCGPGTVRRARLMALASLVARAGCNRGDPDPAGHPDFRGARDSPPAPAREPRRRALLPALCRAPADPERRRHPRRVQRTGPRAPLDRGWHRPLRRPCRPCLAADAGGVGGGRSRLRRLLPPTSPRRRSLRRRGPTHWPGTGR